MPGWHGVTGFNILEWRGIMFNHEDLILSGVAALGTGWTPAQGSGLLTLSSDTISARAGLAHRSPDEPGAWFRRAGIGLDFEL
jgi:hypothetical protein